MLLWLVFVFYVGNVIAGLQVAGLTLLFTLGVLSLVFITAYFSDKSVYIYTNGLVYMNWHRSGLVRWEGIERVDLQPVEGENYSTLAIYLNDGTRIGFPAWHS